VTPPADLEEDLATALGRADATTANSIVAGMVSDLVAAATDADPTQGSNILALLRRHQRFDLMEKIAEALAQAGAATPVLRRQYAQALLERGALTVALDVLEPVVRDCVDTSEVLEAGGLQARAYKQMFVAAGPLAAHRRAHYLNEAINRYQAGYRTSHRNVWHGINAAALLLRAARDGIDVSGTADPQTAGQSIAEEISREIDGQGPAADEWNWTTAVEADLALGRVDSALARLGDQRDRESGPGAFALASLRRQLLDVWQLSHLHEPGSIVLPPLEALLLQQPGAVLTLDGVDGSGPATTEHGFEKVFGAEGAETQAWFEELLRRCRGVARVEDAYEEAVGTGLVIKGTDLHPSWPPLVLVTNAHVIPNGVPAQDAYVTFRGLKRGSTARVRVGSQLWSSPPDRLDATVVELTTHPAGVEPALVAAQFPRLGETPRPRVFVIGHPLGTPAVKISINDNDLLDYDDVKVHYLAPTQPGSSGSPVFDRKWRLLALHHAGSDQMARLHGAGSYQANEGIRIDRIREAIAASIPRALDGGT
jgi:Trypsin-like peptidase domain/MAP3K TRAFs-binding domain